VGAHGLSTALRTRPPASSKGAHSITISGPPALHGSFCVPMHLTEKKNPEKNFSSAYLTPSYPQPGKKKTRPWCPLAQLPVGMCSFPAVPPPSCLPSVSPPPLTVSLPPSLRLPPSSLPPPSPPLPPSLRYIRIDKSNC
jgi:hypothetical protein